MEATPIHNMKEMSIRKQMEQAYRELSALLGMRAENDEKKVSSIIKEAISDFFHSCETPALWCYGEHTHRLMTDYIFEMKKVKFIIDEFCSNGDGGFEIIRSVKVEEKRIDGILISTFKYREEVAETIRRQFPHIKYLDIYQVLHERGIDLNCEYYAREYPYAHYANINKIKQKLKEQISAEDRDSCYKDLLKEFISIKDFKNAISCMEEYIQTTNCENNREIMECLCRVYALELRAASEVNNKNVLMLCIDGLRRRDLFSEEMVKVKKYIDGRGYFFSNAYSSSTSTYESLIPAYSGNNDLRTKYYESNEIEEAECPFIMEAIRQKRNIHFYTDFCQYIKSSYINLTDSYQTAGEKIWNFLLDAVEEENGLFYVHILYESHYSYPNPYTSGKLVAEGTSILFDFLDRNGGRMKTDYIVQHKDALNYLDDLLAPVLERLTCRMVIYADHGNVLLKEDVRLEDIKYPQLTFGEELIQVPLVVCSRETGIGINNRICSIMDINDIIIGLLRGERVVEKAVPYVKVVRSELYNADFRYLYQKMGYSQGLEAFEAFLFQEGWKLVVYADGTTELYDLRTDEKVENDALKEAVLVQVKDEITVCV